jgi:hypothetical protein
MAERSSEKKYFKFVSVSVFQAAAFKRFNFRFRCKADNYNDQSRVRCTVLSAAPINWTEYNRRLIRELQEAGVDLPEKANVSNYV